MSRKRLNTGEIDGDTADEIRACDLLLQMADETRERCRSFGKITGTLSRPTTGDPTPVKQFLAGAISIGDMPS